MSINLDKTASNLDAQIATPYSIPRVNLLPREVLERRAVKRIQQGLGIGLLAVVGLVTGGYLLAVQDANHAADGLAQERAVTTSLNSEQAKYADVPKTLAMVEQVTQARDAALAQDISWSTVVGQMAATYPSGLWIKEFDAALSSPPGSVQAANQMTSPDAAATIKVSGNAKTHDQVASWLDSVKRVSNLTNPKLQSTTLAELNETRVVDFTTTMSLSRGAFRNQPESGN